MTLEIAGNAGTEQLSFAGSSTIAQIATAINAIKEVTGVSAAVSGTTLKFNSRNYGSEQFVSVKALSGTFAVAGGTNGKDTGTDAVVKVNGATAEADGINVTYRSSTLDIEFDLSTRRLQRRGQTKTFAITGGGAEFSLGSKVTESDKTAIGIQSVSTGSLGDGAVGYLSTLASGGANNLSSGNLVQAQKILDKAIKQVSQLRGRLGAFQKFTIGSTVNSLGIAYENASAAESAIRDTDFAEETAQAHAVADPVAAATTVLAQANASPQSALNLLQ